MQDTIIIDMEAYTGHDFSGCVVESPELAKKTFTKCNFAHADLTDVSVIYGCTFDHCNFFGTSLNGITITNSGFLNCKFKDTHLFATTFDECKMLGSSFAESDLSALTITGGDWSYTELRCLEMSKRELVGVNFAGADLTGSSFTKCRIDRCSFADARVGQLSFRDSDIRDSAIGGVDILALDLKNTKIDLEQCIVIAAALGAKYTP